MPLENHNSQETQVSNPEAAKEEAKAAAKAAAKAEREAVSKDVNEGLLEDTESRVERKLFERKLLSIEYSPYFREKAVKEESFDFLKLVIEKIKNPKEFKKTFLEYKEDNDNLNQKQRKEILLILEKVIERRRLARIVIGKNIVTDILREIAGVKDPLEKKTDKISNFLSDPALADILLIKDKWLPKDISITEKAALKTEICRNLFFEKKPVNKSNFNKAYRNLLEKREKTKDIDIIKGRNFVVLANAEKINDGSKHRFATEATISSIKDKDKGGYLPDKRFIRATATEEEDIVAALNKAKIEALKQIVDCPPPMTFCFDGHGGPDAIYLAGGQNPSAASNPDFKITAKEFSQALIDRYKGEKDSDRSNKMPIFIGASEYNQIAYGSEDNPYGNAFLKTTLSGDSSTLGNLVDSDLNQNFTNPSTYIPNGKDLAKRDIFIFSSCFNSTFIRKVINNLQDKYSEMGNVMQLAENTEQSSGSITT